MAQGIKTTTITFIQKAIQIHGDKFDYSLVNYKNDKTKIHIICKEHGVFEQIPSNHLQGAGCFKCKNKNQSFTYRLGLQQFILNAKLAHGDKYDYSKVNYTRKDNKVIIICPIHGEFKQSPNSHVSQKCGCPKCKSSKGETQIRLFLESNNIKYRYEVKFDSCRNKYPLPFDFYLPEANICIEFDGEQHFTPRRSKSIEGKQKSLTMFNRLKMNDKIKDEYCSNNNIRLIRIPYYDMEKIPQILSILV